MSDWNSTEIDQKIKKILEFKASLTEQEKTEKLINSGKKFNSVANINSRYGRINYLSSSKNSFL